MQDGVLSAAAEQQLDALLRSAVSSDDGPGAAVLVACGDTPIYRRALGLANVELNVALSPDNVFRIGSITKVFSAVALLQLCAGGKASLADPLSKFLPHVPNSDHVTLAQLLNHTSGLQSLNLVPGYSGNPCRSDLTTAQLVDSFMSLPPDFPPGQGCKYNNSGFVLVGAVLEVIEGKAWHEVVLAMLSVVAAPHTAYGANSLVVQGMADGYSVSQDELLTRAPYNSMTQPHAAGSLISCLDDLLAFNRALHCGQLLPAASYAAMCTPSAASRDAGLGLGMKTFTVRGQEALGHDGLINGFASMLLYMPESKLTVVVLCNTDKPPITPFALAQRIAAAVLGAPIVDAPSVDVPIEALQALAGRYRQVSAEEEPEGPTVEIVLKSGQLCVGGSRLRPLGGGVFEMKGALTRIEFVDGSSPLQLRLFLLGEGSGVAWQRVTA